MFLVELTHSQAPGSELDLAVEALLVEQGGELDGGGCWLGATPERDLSYVFPTMERAEAVAALLNSKFGDQGVEAKAYDDEEEED